VKKLANFTTDSTVFTMKASEAEARMDISRLAQAFDKEAAFQFTEQEMNCFERLYTTLTP